MCTVSWIHDQNGYQLLCNRDEKLTRKVALEPRLAVRNGTRYLAPADGDFSGTWIGTNAFGVSTCLLNGAATAVLPASPVRSRGLFLLDLLPLPSIAAICDRIGETDVSAYAPFTLVALEPGHIAAVLEWDGSTKHLRFEPADRGMLTSSSFDSEGVRQARLEEYGRVCNGDGLFDFHRSHRPTRSAYSTCMHRTDAKTVSFSQVRVSHGETEFFYTPGALCEQLSEVRFTLARSPASDLG